MAPQRERDVLVFRVSHELRAFAHLQYSTDSDSDAFLSSQSAGSRDRLFDRAVHPVLGAHERAGEYRLAEAHFHHAAISPRASLGDRTGMELRDNVLTLGPDVRHLCRSRPACGKLPPR